MTRANEAGRLETITEKIPRERTGLAGAVFVHVDHRQGKIYGVRISSKWKDGAAFDQVASALGDVITDMLAAVSPA